MRRAIGIVQAAVDSLAVMVNEAIAADNPHAMRELAEDLRQAQVLTSGRMVALQGRLNAKAFGRWEAP